MNANTIRLTEQRDEAQSQVRSLETDVRLLRAALDEAEARKCARCGQVGVGPCGCGFQNEKAGAR